MVPGAMVVVVRSWREGQGTSGADEGAAGKLEHELLQAKARNWGNTAKVNKGRILPWLTAKFLAGPGAGVGRYPHIASLELALAGHRITGLIDRSGCFQIHSGHLASSSETKAFGGYFRQPIFCS